MKLHNIICGTALAAAALTACTDDIAFGNALLEKPSGSTVTIDTVFNSTEYTKQYLSYIYSLQYYGLTFTNGQDKGHSNSYWTGKLDQLTDCWISHWDGTTIYQQYYSGTHDATKQPLITYDKDNVWEAVRACHILIDNIDRVPGMSDATKASYKAQAKCLMAARYFDLFSVFGGLPIVDHAYTGTEGSYNIPRSTVEETVDFMVGLLDDAIDSGALLWAYNGNDSETDDTNTGRWTKAGAMALKAKILTFAASPLFNADQGYYGGTSQAEQQKLVWYGDFQQSRWERAKTACEVFFNAVAANGHYKLVEPADVGCSKTPDGYRQAYRKGYAARGSKEILHSTRVADIDAFKAASYTWHNLHQNPPRLNCLPTEEYVEMFAWSDGTPFNWDKDQSKITNTKNGSQLFYMPKAGKTSKKASRDPRLYEECIVNQQPVSLDWTAGTSGGDIHELWVGGTGEKNGAAAMGAEMNVSDGTYDADGNPTIVEKLVSRYATGYDCNKYFMGEDYLRIETQWVYLSLAEMYLMYAECLAQCDQLQPALDQVQIVRKRVGLTKKLETSTPALKTDKAKLINEILRERACELGITNNRYYDMIRYKRGDWLTQPLHGLVTYRLSQNSAGQWLPDNRPYYGDDKNGGAAEPARFSYKKFQIRNREHYLWQYKDDPTAQQNPTNKDVARWFLFTFPQAEINKGYGLVQNPGWE